MIENRPGAGGRLAAEYVSHQPADGYTLLVGAERRDLDRRRDLSRSSLPPTETFVPLAMIARFPLFMVIAADHPAKTVKEVVEWAESASRQSELCDHVAGLHHHHRTSEIEDPACPALPSPTAAAPT